VGTQLLIPARTGGTGTLIAPGTPDKTHWRGCALGKPFVYDNTAVDGKYYLYFTSHKWYEAAGDWSADNWHETLGVASAEALEGPYTYLNTDAPILEPSSDADVWNYNNVKACSVYENPDYGIADLLNFEDEWTVELLVYLDGDVTITATSEVRLMTRYDSDGNETWSLWLNYPGTGVGRLYGVVYTDGVDVWNNPSDTHRIAPDKVNCVAISYNKKYSKVSIGIQENKVGAHASQSQSYPADQLTPDDSEGGSLIFGNSQNGTKWDANLHILGVRIKNREQYSTTLFTSMDAAVTAEEFAVEDGMPGDETIFISNFDGNTYFFPTGTDEKITGLNEGMTWVAGKGFHPTGNDDRLRLVVPSGEKYVMLLTAEDTTGIIGLAYSDALGSGWEYHETPVFYPSQGGTAVDDPYVTGKSKIVGGVSTPRLFEHPTLGLLFLCDREASLSAWRAEYREITTLYSIPAAASGTLGTATSGCPTTSQYRSDYKGVHEGALVDKVFALGNESFDYTALLTGETIVSGWRQTASGIDERVTCRIFDVFMKGIDL